MRLGKETMSQLTNHLNYAVRQLRRNPGFAATAILTLAIGIGSTTAIFSIFYGVLLRPLPYWEPERLVKITPQVSTPGTDARIDNEASYPNFHDWRDQAHSFEAMASYNVTSLILGGSEANSARNLQAGVVSSDFFPLLGVVPSQGRNFTRAEEKVRTVVLSHELWVSAFHSSPAILGQPLKLSDEMYTVVGVLPETVDFPFVASSAIDLWTTPAVDAVGKNPSTEQRGWNQLDVIARLKRGVSIEHAGAEMNTIQRNLAARYPDEDATETSARVKPALEEMIGDVRPALRILFIAVSALLLIACANVAGLLLARGSSRQAELAVRAALGASRSEITLQLLIESVLLSLMGGAAGVAVAGLTLRSLLEFVPKNTPRVSEITINGPVLAFAIGLSVLTGILFGLLPARRMARLDPALALRDGTRTSTAGRKQHRLHSALVIGETAIGLVLLVGAGLLIRSFLRLMDSDPGFNPRHVLTFRVGITDKNYPEQKRVHFYDQLIARLQALPGANSAAAGFPFPFGGGNMSLTFEIEGRPAKPGNQPDARASVIDGNYLRTLEIPVRSGRGITSADNQESAPPVMLINEALAKKYFPGQDPIGKHVQTGFDSDEQGKRIHWREIVGVVGNVKRVGMAEESLPEYYVPYGQAVIGPAYLALRVSGDPATYANAVTAAVASVDKGLPVYRIRSMDENMAAASALPRFQTLLLTAFAAIALLLAAIGLYAVLSYMVVQRTHEIGLRMALGAQRKSVLRLVLNRGLSLALIGVALGVAASVLLTRFLSSLLYGVKPLDPVTFLSVSAVLLAVSGIASLIPAARAASLEPMKTLRDQ